MGRLGGRMSFDPHSDEYSPPPIDEGYWASLLNDRHADEGVSDDNANSFGTPEDWEELTRIRDEDVTLDLLTVGYNRGGLLVEWRSLRGFVPASQLTEFPINAIESVRRRAILDYIGQILPLRVIELNQERNRVILSERAAQAEPGGRQNILHSVQPGQTVHGTVTNLVEFGAFIDLGGLEGLIHISKLSWGRVSHPRAILDRGQAVDA